MNAFFDRVIVPLIAVAGILIILCIAATALGISLLLTGLVLSGVQSVWSMIF